MNCFKFIIHYSVWYCIISMAETRDLYDQRTKCTGILRLQKLSLGVVCYDPSNFGAYILTTV